MRARLGRLLPGVLVVFLAVVISAQTRPPRPPAPRAAQPKLAVETVASGLVAPWAMAFAPDGRLFVTERAGQIRVVAKTGLQPSAWATVDVVSPEYRSEGGLLGIAVAPDFKTTGHVFVVGTFLDGGQLVNRVLRFTERDGKGADRTVIVDGLPGVGAEAGTEPAIHTHVGGALAFGPDGMLYVTTGDVTRPALSQDPSSLAGKILRYTADGTVPADNPTSGSPIYALGIRNSQGLAWHPDTHDLFATDHGPSDLSWEKNFGGWFGDELNAIVPGSNYGWPAVVGKGVLGRFIDPLVEWSPAIAPSGLAAYSGHRLPWHGDLLVTSLRGEHLVRVVLARDKTSRTGWTAVRQEKLLEGEIGRVRAIAMGPDGNVYVASSNRDGRGKVRAGDDRVVRIGAAAHSGPTPTVSPR